MGDNHTVYERPEGQTTQWEDIQRKMGNLPAAPKVWKPDAWSAKEERPRGAALVDGDADAVDGLEGEFDDDRFLEEYRAKRLAELREKEERGREGRSQGKRGVVTTISKGEYVSMVTRASAGFADSEAGAFTATTTRRDVDYDDKRGEDEEEDEEEQVRKRRGSENNPPAEHSPRWVVCHMFREGVTACDDVDEALRQLADSPAASAPSAASAAAASSSSSSQPPPPPPPRVSFVRIRADDVAPGYPLSALPTLLVYFGGECVASLKGKDALVAGAGGGGSASAASSRSRRTSGGGNEDDDDSEKRIPYSSTSRGSSAGRISTAAVLAALEASAPGIMTGSKKKNNKKKSDSGGSDSE